MFDIKNSKFYAEIMGGLSRFFGLESATEAELHQTLTEAGTLADIKANAASEANAAVASQMTAFQTQLDALNEKFTAAEASDAEKTGKITELSSALDTLIETVAQKDTVISNQTAQIASLSGELAALKAGKPLANAVPAPADPAPPIPQNARQSNASVMTMGDFFEAIK